MCVSKYSELNERDRPTGNSLRENNARAIADSAFRVACAVDPEFQSFAMLTYLSAY